MHRQWSRVRRSAVAVLAMGLLGSAFVAPGAGASVSRQVRGFDGTTIKVAGIGNPAQLGTVEVGARARIKRFNDDNELKGIKLDYTEFADDKGDPATALSEARRLVTQEQVFALVGDGSLFNPGAYLTQQHVPFFGWGFETAYCSPKVTTTLWGFGYNGCQNNPNPTLVVDFGRQLLQYATAQTGKKHPTIAMIANDTPAGKTTIASNVVAYKGAGFKVVDAEANVPLTGSVGDYTPYAQQLLTADNGKPPDVMLSLMGIDSLNVYSLVKAAGYTGIFNHTLLTDILVKPFDGSVAVASNAPLSTVGNAALDQMKADVQALKPGQQVDSPLLAGYASTDMFIQALKTVAKKGKSNITPENIQKVAATQKWEMKDFTGPVNYPVASNRPVPYCTALSKSDGTQWVAVEPYSCSTRTFVYKK